MHFAESVWPPRLHSSHAPAAFNELSCARPPDRPIPVDGVKRSAGNIERRPAPPHDLSSRASAARRGTSQLQPPPPTHQSARHLERLSEDHPDPTERTQA